MATRVTRALPPGAIGGALHGESLRLEQIVPDSPVLFLDRNCGRILRENAGLVFDLWMAIPTLVGRLKSIRACAGRIFALLLLIQQIGASESLKDTPYVWLFPIVEQLQLKNEGNLKAIPAGHLAAIPFVAIASHAVMSGPSNPGLLHG
jgi:hypothetical protein